MTHKFLINHNPNWVQIFAPLGSRDGDMRLFHLGRVKYSSQDHERSVLPLGPVSCLFLHPGTWLNGPVLGGDVVCKSTQALHVSQLCGAPRMEWSWGAAGAALCRQCDGGSGWRFSPSIPGHLRVTLCGWR